MSRQLEQEVEDRAKRKRKELIHAVYGGLDAALQAAGYEFLGFSARLAGGDCLLTLRLDCAEGRLIAFVGAEDLPGALVKAVREAKGGQLRTRPDKYAG